MVYPARLEREDRGFLSVSDCPFTYSPKYLLIILSSNVVPRRLKMNFVNVGCPTSAQTLNTASAPVLASCFSDVFSVFSAKKFPGVIESTNLSKCFATQGIKIPIRKDGVRGNERRPGDGDDDE